MPNPEVRSLVLQWVALALLFGVTGMTDDLKWLLICFSVWCQGLHVGLYYEDAELYRIHINVLEEFMTFECILMLLSGV